MRYEAVVCLATILLAACGADDTAVGDAGPAASGDGAAGGAGQGADASVSLDGSQGGGGGQGGEGSGGREAGQQGGSDGAGAGRGSGGEGGAPDGGAPDGGDSGQDAGGQADSNPAACEPLPAANGSTISVQAPQVAQLQSIAANAKAGDTILLEDGVYELNGAYLWIDAPGVTIRSRSGDRDRVTLDGAYQSTEIITVAASDVTVADITIKRAYTHAIHVVSTDSGDTLNTLIYNVHIVDSREQAIKINPHAAAIHFTDRGTVACSHIELSDAGRPHVNPDPGGCYTGGVDAHQARGWVIRDNLIEGFWCPSGLAEHGVHMWRGCRDSIVERNRFLNNARAVGFGLDSSGAARVYEDDPCPGAGYVGHYGGIVRNNFVFTGRSELANTTDAVDCGICLWSACKARALHNTFVSTIGSFSAIEWRFAASTGVEISNNLVTHALRERDGASAVQSGNLSVDSLDMFLDGPQGDLHLAPGAAAAIDQGTALADDACSDDIDGERRDQAPDIGADEIGLR